MSYRDREYLRTLVAYLCKLHNLPDDVTDTATYNVLHSNVKNVSAKAKVIIIVYLTAIKNGYYVPLEVLSKSLDFKNRRRLNSAKRAVIEEFLITLDDIINLFGALFDLNNTDKQVLKKEVEKLAKNETQQTSITFTGAVLYKLSKEGKIKKKILLADLGEKLNKPTVTFQKMVRRIKLNEEPLENQKG
jgi:hypothetical protein